MLREQCENAAKRATHQAIKTHAFGDFWTCYRAELQIECFDAVTVERIIAAGRHLSARRRPVWEI